jgi:hypothetical protein
MERGSKFIAALMAVIVLGMFQPHSPPTPFWQEVAAALIGALIAWLMDAGGDRLKALRRGRRVHG